MDILNRYIEYLLRESTPEKPVWNIEKIKGDYKPKWNYIDGCMMTALIELWQITGEDRYFDFVKEFIDYYLLDEGRIRGYEIKDYNIDNINEGRVLFDLYEQTGNHKYLKAIEIIYQQIKEQPRTKEGNFWHKAIYPNQVWLDGIYMAQPFYIRYETKFTKHEHYRDIFSQIKNVRMMMYSEESKLYFHGYDSEKSIFWADGKTGLSKNHWLRAMGWFVVALVDILDIMNEELFYMYRTIRNILKEALDGLLLYQSEEGMWYQVIDQKNTEGNYLETSGSAMIAYAILKGVRLGVLPDRFRAYGIKAYNGIVDHNLSEKSGKLNLNNICLVSGLGPEGNERRDGSIEYYLSEPIVENDAKGVAPLILAYTEIIRLK